MTDLSRRIGDYAASLSYALLPPEVVHQTKRTILDTVGCAFGGYRSKPSDIAHDLAATISSTKPATIWCSGRRTSVDLAAFANDIMVRYLDHNDGYISKGSGHPSDTVAALIPVAEMVGSSGRDLILATVIAYEVFGRMCDVWANKKSGIDHVTMGIAATTVGAARLYGLDAAQISEALNMSLAGNIALNQTRFGNVSNWKAAGYANANRNAIFSVEMAARGMTGPSPIFEGKYGFFNIVSHMPFELAPFGPEATFRIMHSSAKRFPLGQYAQTVAQAALDARVAIGGRYQDIDRVTVRTLKTGLLVMADEPDKWRPRNRETADHSMPFTAGVALKHGSVKHEHFDDFTDPELVDLVSRIACIESDEANAREAEMNLCELELVMKSGDVHATRVEHHRGHWRNPMSDAEIEEKFRELSHGFLPAGQATALIGALWALDSARDLAPLVALTILPEA
ncbi:MAG: MmgE/PrpD family protein [Devosia sp.]|uniref:MmgE/PrpD family protein n=1 Tax=Devosia sp. TaxID=1871048 RepID=UPI0026232C33|nr:MmgE/PrpD family protein [Devosia sp.]MDB5541712.1 MmgE/PrpD family protein [Devosia sp.]